MLVTHYASIWKFLDHIRKTFYHSGIGRPRKCETSTKEVNQQQIERIVDNYQAYKDRGEIKVYLRSLSFRLKLQSEPIHENEDEM